MLFSHVFRIRCERTWKCGIAYAHTDKALIPSDKALIDDLLNSM
ncbi:hypothetical protein L21SP2_0494 [Salinispira pacifica]|uniref:Uncharacterized protein n=1 Tax=Salinispira pacifica TaxID=1307761 RepID=V5WFH0_9SPIO|nr:hypothetical protein L21SP2_0494 [Salinispira pacifica]